LNICLSINLRLALLSDNIRLWTWRNDQHSRAMSKDSRIIPWKEHQQWFLRALFDKDVIIFIAENDGRSIGTARLNIDNNTALISLTIATDYRSRGYGRQLLRSLCAYARDILKIDTLYAEIKKNNIASLHCFEKEHFKKYDEENEYIKYLLKGD